MTDGPPESAAVPAAVPAAVAAADSPGRRWLAGALGLLLVLVLVEVIAGPTLTPAHTASHQAQVLATGGVSTMLHGVEIDPTELAQVAAAQRQPAPLAFPAQALIDGLLLVGAAGLALPRFLARGGVARRSQMGSFVASLVILLVGIAVGVVAIARLRFLVALYRSPPLGTLSYLLLYGSSRPSATLVVLTVVMALKVGACLMLFRGLPTVAEGRAAGDRGMAGLALTSVAGTVVVAFGYALASSALASIADALVAAAVALAAVLWAGVIVSGSVRRLA